MSSFSYTHVTCGSSSTPVVGHGSSYSSHSTVSLGPLTLSCSGEINEQLWGAGAALAAYLYNLPLSSPTNPLSKKPDVLELGAGTGLVGLVAAFRGCSALITDLPSCVPYISSNIAANSSSLPTDVVVEAAALQWGDTSMAVIEELLPSGVDVVFGADLHYNPDFFRPLLRTIEHVCGKRPNTRVFIATEQRWEAVNEEWDKALEESQMVKIDEKDIPTPPNLLRRVVLIELQLKKT